MTEHNQPEAASGTQAEDASTLIPYALIGALSGAVGGAVVGLTFVNPWIVTIGAGFGLGRILPEDSSVVGFLWAFIGALIGVASALVIRRRELRREAVFRWITETLGGQFTPGDDATLDKALARFFHDSGAWSHKTRDIARVRIDGVEFVVCDLQFYAESGRSSDSRTRTVRQTVAYHASDTLRFPGFGMQPKQPFGSLFARLSHQRTVDFSGHSEFSQRYQVNAEPADVEDTRRFFTAELLEHIGRAQGLWMSSGERELVLYRREVVCEDEALKDFVILAGRTFRLFEAAARKSHLVGNEIQSGPGG